MNPIEPSFPIFEYVEVLRVNGDGIETVKQLQATKQFTAFLVESTKQEIEWMEYLEPELSSRGQMCII